MKQFISLMLSIIMLFTMFSVVGSAVEGPLVAGVVYDIHNEEFYWELSEEGGTLTISGNGYMMDVGDEPEWLSYSFTKLVISDGIGDVPEKAFAGADDLEVVELADSVDVIRSNAFNGCQKLKKVKFSDVSVIESKAFYGCVSFKDIKLSKKIEAIGDYAFGYYTDKDNDKNYEKISDVSIYALSGTVAHDYASLNNINYIDTRDYSDYFTYKKLEDDTIALTSFKECPYSADITIPEKIDGYDVSRLGSYLFENSDVKSVIIPKTVTKIYSTTFENADELKKIICRDNSNYATKSGALYSKDYEKLIKVPEGKTMLDEFPKALEDIGVNAFKNSGITDLKLPKTIKTIGDSAFAYSSLIEITLPYGLEKIGKLAFCGSELKEVIIPVTVEGIGKKAFGYNAINDEDFVKIQDFKIQGKNNTAAEEYADNNGFAFEDVSPSQPKIKNTHIGKTAITLFWEKVSNVKYYEIYRKTADSDFDKIATVKSSEDAVYVDFDVKNNVTYTYSIVSVNGNMKSSANKSVDVKFIKLSVPQLVSANMSNKGIRVEWESVSGAQGYIICRKLKNGSWKEIAEVNDKTNVYEDVTCQSGETYCYTVKAYKNTVESGCDYDGVSAMYLGIPKLQKAENVAKGIKLTWKKVEGANGYIIGRKTSSTDWTKIAQIDDVSYYIDKTAKAGSTYTYTVVPVNDNVKGFYDEDGITYRRISRVVTKGATNTADGVKIVWEPVSKCSGYRVYRKTEDGSWKRIATIKGAIKSYYIDKKAKSGIKYDYMVKAYSGAYVSAYTDVSRYYLEAPELLSAKSGKSGVTAKWETVDGATGYYIYRKTGNGDFEKIATAKGESKSSYVDKSAKNGKTYTYKIKAYYSKTTSAYSNTKKVTDKY